MILLYECRNVLATFRYTIEDRLGVCVEDVDMRSAHSKREHHPMRELLTQDEVPNISE